MRECCSNCNREDVTLYGPGPIQLCAPCLREVFEHYHRVEAVPPLVDRMIATPSTGGIERFAAGKGLLREV